MIKGAREKSAREGKEEITKSRKQRVDASAYFSAPSHGASFAGGPEGNAQPDCFFLGGRGVFFGGFMICEGRRPRPEGVKRHEFEGQRLPSARPRSHHVIKERKEFSRVRKRRKCVKGN